MIVLDVLGGALLVVGLALMTISLIGVLRLSGTHNQLHAQGLATGPGVIAVRASSVATEDAPPSPSRAGHRAHGRCPGPHPDSAQEVAPFRITVNACFAGASGPGCGRISARGSPTTTVRPAVRIQEIRRGHRPGPAGDPEDVAASVSYLPPTWPVRARTT